jgi:phage shock protein PspC (stress-responsive transcriptional regulator)
MEEFKDDRTDDSEPKSAEEDGTDSHREIHIHKLSKSNYNKIILGVCGGLGEYFSIEPVFFRLLFLFSILLGGWGIILYLITALLMPRNNDENEIDESALENIRKSNNVSLIAGIILLAGLYLIFDNLGYFDFLSRLGIPSEFVLALIIGVIIFFVFSLHSPVKVEKEVPERFTRSSEKALLGGVCAGFADYIGVSANSIRLIAVFLSFVTLGIPVLIYLFFLSIIPKEERHEI